MKQDDIIEHEGRRFQKIGAGKPVKGEWYLTPITRRPAKAVMDFSITLDLLREIPAEPAPQTSKLKPGFCQKCGGYNDYSTVNQSHQCRCPKESSPQPGEAVRELARTLKELPPISGDYERVISEALRPLLEKAWDAQHGDPSNERVANFRTEFARWQGGGE